MFASACAGSVKKLESKGPDASGTERREFRVDCFELDECKQKATQACGSRYDIVSEWHNTIPESDLPGLNEESRVKDSSDWDVTLPREDGIESDEPMPATQIVVACN